MQAKPGGPTPARKVKNMLMKVKLQLLQHFKPTSTALSNQRDFQSKKDEKQLSRLQHQDFTKNVSNNNYQL